MIWKEAPHNTTKLCNTKYFVMTTCLSVIYKQRLNDFWAKIYRTVPLSRRIQSNKQLNTQKSLPIYLRNCEGIVACWNTVRNERPGCLIIELWILPISRHLLKGESFQKSEAVFEMKHSQWIQYRNRKLRNNIFISCLVDFWSAKFLHCAFTHPWERLPGTRGAVISYKSTSSEISGRGSFPAARGVGGGGTVRTIAHNSAHDLD